MDDILYDVSREKNHVMYSDWPQRLGMKDNVTILAKGKTVLLFEGLLKIVKFSK